MSESGKCGDKHENQLRDFLPRYAKSTAKMKI